MKCPNPSCGSTKAYLGLSVVECPNQNNDATVAELRAIVSFYEQIPAVAVTACETSPSEESIRGT